MTRSRRPAPRRLWKARLIVLALCACGSAHAAELVVRISGLSAPLGQVGCSLFAEAAGFPMNNATARAQWAAADGNGAVCRFAEVPEGSYAVAVLHDLNGNRRADTNFIGLPTEQWGVSNNARPSLRAPRFDEAVFRIAADAKQVTVDIKVAK